MKQSALLSLCLVSISALAASVDFNGLTYIGPVASHVKSQDGITVTCDDHSQVRFQVLAPDLVRVRASFGKALPERDHSWAIEKTAWDAPQWTLKEAPAALTITTDELEVVIQRSPLKVEFRDAKTHKLINADERPVMYDPASGKVAAFRTLGFEEHIYGLGEKAARLDKRRGQFTMWNMDTPAYKEGTDPLYQDIPFYLGWQDGTAYGIFFDNSFRTNFDFGTSLQEYSAFSADGGEMNYYFFWGPSIKKILGRYADLTGHMPMPPMWTLGNQQSRWGYYNDTRAEQVVSKYRADDLPLDAIYLDIHYMSAYRVFTWDPQRFPDPSGLTARLREKGVNVVPIVDPGVKYQPPTPGAKDAEKNPELQVQDQSYYVFNQGVANNYFLKRKSGELWIGKVWPGDAVYVDYTLDAAAKWWGDLFRGYTDHGVAGIWTDMNEPSDFIDQSGKTQMDVVFHDGGTNTMYAQNRNVFALGMARATRAGLERLKPNERPFVITRAAYAGIQRYSTTWTGDNTTTWESLELSIPMFQSLGLSGQPFIGADIGGFIGRTNAELQTRWYEVGFLTPLCRNHSDLTGYDHEPWRFGEFHEGIIRKYLKLRYRLLPFLYTELEAAHRTGVPMFRPLLLNYQNDYNTVTIDDQFMVGADLLAAPVVKQGQVQRPVYLPAGTWFDYWTGKQYTGGTTIQADAPLETVPLYVRGGAIVPMGPEMNYVGEKKGGPLTFAIYPDAQGHAEATLYEDDGASPAYAKGDFRRTAVTYQASAGGAEITVGAPAGPYQTASRTLVFLVRGSKSVHGVSLDGKSLAMQAGHSGAGWYPTGDAVTVQLADDGKAHKLSLR